MLYVASLIRIELIRVHVTLSYYPRNSVFFKADFPLTVGWTITEKSGNHF